MNQLDPEKPLDWTCSKASKDSPFVTFYIHQEGRPKLIIPSKSQLGFCAEQTEQVIRELVECWNERAQSKR